MSRERFFGSLLLVAFTGVSGIACESSRPSDEVTTAREAVIYGEDNRYEPFDYPDPVWTARVKGSSVALFHQGDLATAESGNVEVRGSTLGQVSNVCADERFVTQPASALCSGTLIGPDVVLTAGHCMRENACGGIRIVFNYAMNSADQLATIAGNDVYRCAEVIASTQGEADYAVLRLDRPVSDRVPARLRLFNTPVEIGQSLVFASHPSGLPLKIADSAEVTDPRASTLDHFLAPLDSFGGSSGAGVFLKDTAELVGLVLGGVSGGDFVRSDGEECARPRVLPTNGSDHIWITYAANAVGAYCAAAAPDAASRATLCPCGNGTCEAGLGENTISCPTDCGARCGDGICNGEENGSACYEDCGVCGNSQCEPFEAAHLSCCGDCGCPSSYSCQLGACLPTLGNVNSDGLMDERDVCATRAMAFGAWSEPARVATADVDCDGRVSEDDAQILKEYLAGERAWFPCEQIVQVATGARHTCVLLGSGQVRCWGDNTTGQLGVTSATSPVSGAHSTAVALGSKATQIVAGNSHTCALLEGGAVKCWGAGNAGQLGYGATTNVLDPRSTDPVSLGAAATRLSAGASQTCAILTDGTVRCWGANASGQLGLGNTMNLGDNELPSDVSPLQFGDGVVELALGTTHSCALTSSGNVYCWGANSFGQLGLGHTRTIGDDEVPSVAGPVSLGGTAQRIAAGILNTCALMTSGELRCWGDNTREQLGYGTTQRLGDKQLPSSTAPVPLGAPAQDVVVGAMRVCALYGNGQVRCWGSNTGGQLGNGTTRPMQLGQTAAAASDVVFDAEVHQLATASDHTCVLLGNGTLRCWGLNTNQQLGYGHTNAIGDNELPNTAGAVPLFGTKGTGWHFVNPYQLEVNLERSNPNPYSGSLELRIANRGCREVADFRVLFQVNAEESGGAFISLTDESTPRSSPSLRLERSGAATVPLYSLIYDFAGTRIEPGHAGHGRRGSERVTLGFTDPNAAWKFSN
ncbi:MAG TPA: trypsin-like serine protease, partial [Polyangiaceae bacterium]|nr:trypsin-like serine protease [Polyangiaceae bacterium]